MLTFTDIVFPNVNFIFFVINISITYWRFEGTFGKSNCYSIICRQLNFIIWHSWKLLYKDINSINSMHSILFAPPYNTFWWWFFAWTKEMSNFRKTLSSFLSFSWAWTLEAVSIFIDFSCGPNEGLPSLEAVHNIILCSFRTLFCIWFFPSVVCTYLQHMFFALHFFRFPIGKVESLMWKICFFKEPQPPVPWTKVKRCEKSSPVPLQYSFVLKVAYGRENCLFLNVYTPKVSKYGIH